MRHYLIAYDIAKSSRRRKIAKKVYSYALGGQKSALEVVISSKEADFFAYDLLVDLNLNEDKVNIIHVDSKPILLGKAKQLNYSEGMIII